MKIEIKKKGSQTAVLISFNTTSEKFESHSERNKFFSELHGRKQIIIKNEKRYEYRREGLLDEIPNLKVDNSVFIIMQEHLRQMMEFFNEWEDKVSFKTFPILLNREELEQLKAKPKEEEVE